jgi:hypothetical protein
MSGRSWQAFADALQAENAALGELGAAALELTRALVFGNAAAIEAADRQVNARRMLHAEACQRRTKMMTEGFGDLPLRQVCAYAPAPMRRELFVTLRELRTRGVALKITLGNNKALITAGLKRIAAILTALQKSVAERTGTYRRRGRIETSNASIIMSRKA